MANNNVYVAGGSAYFKKTGEATFFDFGKVEELKINVSTEYAEAYDHSGSTRVLVAKIPKKHSAKITFKTTNITEATISAFAYGTATSVVHTDTEAGWDEINVKKISGFQNALLEGTFKIVSENKAGKEMILDVHRCVISPTGDFSFQSEDVNSVTFEGEVMLSATGDYFDWYVKG